MKIPINEICTYNFPCESFFGLKWEIVCFAHQRPFMKNNGYSFMLRSRNQTTNQIPRSYKNDGFDWPFDLVIVT